jgi:hypothetical protein
LTKLGLHKRQTARNPNRWFLKDISKKYGSTGRFFPQKKNMFEISRKKYVQSSPEIPRRIKHLEN